MNKYTKNNLPKLFSEEETCGHRVQIFKETKLGKIHASLPLEELGTTLPIRQEGTAGAPSWFGNAGMFAVMFLKHYLNLSDEMLVDRINTDWELQMFCGRQFGDNDRIRDRNLPSRIRSYIGNNLSLETFQEIMIEQWSPHMGNTHCSLFDATAYESYVKYPTDEKLLWDCCVWIFECIYVLCKELGVKRPRHKYREQSIKQLAFSKTRKKTFKLRKRRRNSLLYLLNQGIVFMDALLAENAAFLSIAKYLCVQEKLKTVRTIFRQQTYMHEHPGEYVKNRIVSFFKPYLRPIIRGKENKRVEFGAKAHIYQVDGINLIDKLSFDPYNEALCLKGCVDKHNRHFGELHQLGVDNIYGTNKNRTFITENKICTCLPRKGRPPKHDKQTSKMRQELGRQRATGLEGSFGNEKNHYGLRKVKARTQNNEIVWILFGIMTANAVKISKRTRQQEDG
ncbi:transposase [Saccharicrinis sp. GN24d3]|uniref:transposase n=1 Tax=Saccharicrinis sp. GN24d3 TaxID=3458416 RepID=UPI00403566E1